MRGKYEAAFIVPNGAKKILGDDGWTFESPNRLYEGIKNYLIEALGLSFHESYCEIEVYVGDDMKMGVYLDEQRKIEFISFQLCNESLAAFSKVWQSSDASSKMELFIPSIHATGGQK